MIRVLHSHGFAVARQRGSHRQFAAVVGNRRRLVTVAGKPGDDVPGTILSSIKQQSGLPERAFRPKGRS